MVNHKMDLDNIFMALADPVRRSFVRKLSAGEATLTDLAEPLAMTMPAIMKHVSVLEKSGIVHTEKRGRSRYCQLNPSPLAAAEDWLVYYRQFWKERLDELDDYLKQDK